MSANSAQFDAVVVGAGFAGLYMLHRLRELGMTVKVIEAASGVGGTWFWNRYPGARCDAESLAYSYSFSPELEQEWQWTERYATQPEILQYIEHVAERFDMHRDIDLNTRVTHAHFQAADNLWQVRTLAESGAEGLLHATYCIMATGCLSVPQLPDIPGINQFAGNLYQASRWPHEEISFAGQSVGVIGTGSSSIQAIPVIAQTAQQLTVFQRTPNYSVPAHNKVLDPHWIEQYKANYRAHRQDYKLGLVSSFGDLLLPDDERGVVRETPVGLPDAEVSQAYERAWEIGGARAIGAYGDVLSSAASNAKMAEFVRNKIRSTVTDPVTAELLCPKDYPIGTKRICVDSDYYETYNLDHVSLVDVSEYPIETITPTGLRTGGKAYELDTLVLATGFDAMTGPLFAIDIRGIDGQKLRDKWSAGPTTYLGLATAGFPNFCMITGPGSPSVLSNMIVSIEQHVDWITDLLQHLAALGHSRFDVTPAAETDWVAHVNEVADATLFPQGGSWYLGANVPNKPRVFMPYAAGVGPYREICDGVAADGYPGFRFA